MPGTLISNDSQIMYTLKLLVDSKTRTYHGRVGAGRRIAGPEGTSTVRLAQEISVPRAHRVTKKTVLNVSSEARTV